MEHDVLDTLDNTTSAQAVATSVVEEGRSNLKTGLMVGGIIAVTVALGGLAFKAHQAWKGRKEDGASDAEAVEEVAPKATKKATPSANA